SDCHVRTDESRATTRRIRSVVGDVHHRTVLDAGARAHFDRVDVAAQDGGRPDGRVVTEFHATDDDRRRIDEDPRAERGGEAAIGSDTHAAILPRAHPGFNGNRTMTSLPLPTPSLRAWMVPPCSATSSRASAKPMPMPARDSTLSGCTCVNSSKIS